jgi:DNA-binding NarL/FixJ family response regulator
LHIIKIKAQDFPVQFRPIIDRLQKAVQVKEVRDVMEIEDHFIKEIMDYEDRVKIQETLVAEERLLKEEAQRKQEEAQRKQEEAQRKQEEAIKLMLKSGINKAIIAEQLQLSITYIESLE